MKKGKAKLLIRLVLVIGIMGFALWSVIQLTGYFNSSSTKKRIERITSFGILLPARYKIHGIDVSRHQEDIDRKRVDSMRSNGQRIRFVFIKATEGISRQDPSFEKNWKNIRKSRLLRGAYHFYYPSRDALEQSNNFISQVELEKGDLPPVVDIEYTNGRSKTKICKGLSVFITALEKHYKVKPIIYTNLSFYNDYLDGQFDTYPLWISCYFEEERFEASCQHQWTFWQHSERGKVDGISGSVDFNVFKGSEDDLRKLCIP
jgi:lysozyme